jgi:hypothetical protein
MRLQWRPAPRSEPRDHCAIGCANLNGLLSRLRSAPSGTERVVLKEVVRD